MIQSISEILKKTSELKSRQEKIDFLRKNQTTTLLMILQYALDPNIQWILPEGNPPFKKNDLVDMEGMLHVEARRLKNWIKGVNPDFEKQELRNQAQFISLLESLNSKDAELVIAAKDKKIPYKGITYKLVKEAFPHILP